MATKEEDFRERFVAMMQDLHANGAKDQEAQYLIGSLASRLMDKTGANFYKGTDEADSKVVAAVERLAEARGVPMAHVALAWLLAQPGVTAPIVGVSKMQHLEDALGALEVSLSPEDLAALEAPYVPHPVSGHE